MFSFEFLSGLAQALFYPDQLPVKYKQLLFTLKTEGHENN